MENEGPEGYSSVNSIRNECISRRGGVRTRGGRLPPINVKNFQILSKSVATSSSKKMVAPKIPQRRVIKQEVVEDPAPEIKREPYQSEGKSGRDRQPKVYLQTEGTFLDQGPAARMKRERISDPCAYIPRSRSSVKVEESAVDPAVIKDLLDSYDDHEAYEDEGDTIPPVRLPRMKPELLERLKKEEAVVKAELKTEGDEEDYKRKAITKIDEVRNEFEEFCRVKDEGMLILLHWPNCFPAENEDPGGEKADAKKAAQEPVEKPLVEKLPEGKVGKLQFLKSGRKRLLLGPLVFTFKAGSESDATKEVVTLRMTDSGGDLAVLGKIDRIMVIKSVLEDLLK